MIRWTFETSVSWMTTLVASFYKAFKSWNAFFDTIPVPLFTSVSLNAVWALCMQQKDYIDRREKNNIWLRLIYVIVSSHFLQDACRSLSRDIEFRRVMISVVDFVISHISCKPLESFKRWWASRPASVTCLFLFPACSHTYTVAVSFSRCRQEKKLFVVVRVSQLNCFTCIYNGRS